MLEDLLSVHKMKLGARKVVVRNQFDPRDGSRRAFLRDLGTRCAATKGLRHLQPVAPAHAVVEDFDLGRATTEVLHELFDLERVEAARIEPAAPSPLDGVDGRSVVDSVEQVRARDVSLVDEAASPAFGEDESAVGQRFRREEIRIDREHVIGNDIANRWLIEREVEEQRHRGKGAARGADRSPLEGVAHPRDPIAVSV